MDETIFAKALSEGAAELGVALSDGQTTAFRRYMELLLDWNTRMNLTAITDEPDIISKHFLDSLSLFAAADIPVGASVIDVGTGAGFPGLPMKLARADIRLTLLDSLNKRLLFLEECVGELGLTEMPLHHLRAEEGARKLGLRDAFDFCVSRAVADLAVLTEYCLPYVATGGYFLAMKGADCQTELRGAKRAIRELSGVLEAVKTIRIPGTDITHSVVMIRKIRQTPPRYPRIAAKISKFPIK